jgi:hypothetical protein
MLTTDVAVVYKYGQGPGELAGEGRGAYENH